MASEVVVITGASAGIGAALAKELAKRQARLVLAARRGAELAAVGEATGTKCLAVVADVTRRSDVERLRDEAIREFGRVDVWVNNAGRGINRKVADLSDDDLDEMIAVNVKSALYGMQAILPHFQDRRAGHIINISSFLGRVPLVGFRSAYSAAKAALNSLTANLRMDLAATHPGIKVSLVMPGIVATEFSRNALGGVPNVPSGGAPAQSAEDVAVAVAALIDRPVAELYTNPASPEIARGYFADVAAWEANALKGRGGR